MSTATLTQDRLTLPKQPPTGRADASTRGEGGAAQDAGMRPALASIALHAAILLAGGGLAASRGPLLAVDAGKGVVEVTLIAAPPAAQASRAVAVAKPQPRLEAGDIADPRKRRKKPAAEQESPPAEAPEAQARSEAAGDGSSPKPGQDATTEAAGTGAITQAQPNYLRNPAPRYPERARMLKQEGVVYIRALITPEGAVKELSLSRSSGFPLLDEAALKAVERWKFQPARRGDQAIEAQVEVPVRFRLRDA